MNISTIIGKCSTALSRLVAASMALTLVAVAAPGENSALPSLDDYLKRVGYLPVMLKCGKHEELLTEGVLAKKKRLFFVDTGWSKTALSKRAARGLKSIGELDVTLEDSFWGKLTDPSIVIMEELTLGRAQFFNQPARVTDLRMDFVSARFDGVLGCDFLFRNFCLIDCSNRRLYVRGSIPSDDTTLAVEATLRASGFKSVPIIWKGGVEVEAKVKNETFKLIVDTGSTFSILDSALAKRLGLAAAKHDDVGSLMKMELSTTVIGVGEIGAHKMWVTTLQTLDIGSLQWTNVHVGVTGLTNWGLAVPGSESEEVQGL